MKSFTSVRGLSRAALVELIEASVGCAERVERHEPPGGELAGRAVATVFFEPSTRTRLSFELAARRLGADVLSFDPNTSSTSKGESIRDTVLTLAAIGADMFVVRHSEPGLPDAVGDWTGVPVVNAGDGANEHPTQALIDAVTLHRHFAGLEGLRMAVVGDIAHSRVAGSLIPSMPALGVELTLVGPEPLLPTAGSVDVATSTSLDDHLGGLDVVYLLRVQRERGTLLSDDYVERYGMNSDRAASLKQEAVVMHPGPINRGIEITGDVADGPRSLILDQVRNGVPTRMAVLTVLMEGLT